jgi:endo-1,4-beta-xylanase
MPRIGDGRCSESLGGCVNDGSRRTAFTRRACLAGLVGGACLGTGRRPALAAPRAADDPFADLPPLKGAARGKPAFGLTANAARIPKERKLFARMAAEMDLFTPESNFQWSAMEPKPGQWNWQPTDAGLAWATANDIRVVGHALLYHWFIPDWLKTSRDAKTLTEALHRRIDMTLGRYQGRIARWDVVNEPLNARDGMPGDLRRTAYSQTLGETYLDLAFKAARAADPKAVLCLNEAEIEYDDQADRRASLLALLRRLKDRGVPIDVLGLQSHLDAGKKLDLKGLREFLAGVRSLGLKIAVTELDIIDRSLPGDPSVRDKAVAEHARQYLEAVRAESNLVSVTCWGMNDRNTWLDMWHARDDGRPLRPLPFDFDLRRKELWNVIRQVVLA